MFDVTRKESLTPALNWIQIIKEHFSQYEENTDKIGRNRIVLIGNKCDEIANREVDYETGVRFALENGIAHYIETSAKTGENVELGFITLAAETVKEYTLQENKQRMKSGKEEGFVNNCKMS